MVIATIIILMIILEIIMTTLQTERSAAIREEVVHDLFNNKSCNNQPSEFTVIR